MNANKGIVISENENGFMPQHVTQNSNQSVEKTISICEKFEADQLKESLSKRVGELNNQKGEGSSSKSKDPSLLGLKLTVTPSFECDLAKRKRWLKEEQQRQENESLRSRLANRKKTKSDELPAANFPALCLRIGAWQRIAMHEGDLVVKVYFTRQKLVWDMLDRPLKSKMEINWSDICSMRAIAPVNEPGILEIELIQPPVYFREICPQPKKHTLWDQSPDFTGGQALIWRRHQLIFSPGMLERIYENLFQCNEYLNALSRKPFPRHESPYFDPTFSGHGANKVAQYPYQAYPIVLPRDPSLRATPYPATSAGGNYNFEAQNQASWQQSVNTPRDNFGLHGTLGIRISPTKTNINNIHDSQFPATINISNVYDPSFPPNTNINNVYDTSFPQATNINSVYTPPHYGPNGLGLTGTKTDEILDSFELADALLETIGPVSPLMESMESSYQQDMAFHAITGDQGNNNNRDLNGMIPDPNHWLAAQGSNGSTQNVVQGANGYTFQGANENMFHVEHDNMYQGANDYMFELAGYNSMRRM